MKKILFANMPYDGHFNPLTGIAMHLKALGHDVRWYSGSYYQPKAEKLGIPFYPFQKAVDFNQHNVNDIFPERVKLDSQIKKLKYDLKTSFVMRSTEFYEDIREINKLWCFDLMISDIAFTGLPFVKELLNKKVISIGVFPLTENSRDLPPAGLGMVPSESFWGRRKQDVLRFVADQVIFRESAALFRKLFKEYGVKPASGNPFDILGQKSDLLLQSGSPGFEFKRSDLSGNIRFVGALLPFSSGTKSAFEFGDKLKGFEKVILVTQGTLEKDPEKIIIPTLEAFKDSKYLVIATTGGSRTEELRTRFPYKNIIVEDFIPFNDIMPHCDVYITNGGYGGVMLGIENELPMLVAGIHEGKNEINARVGYFKIGVDLRTEFPSPAQILINVEKILADGEYKSNVKNLSRELKEYDTTMLCEKYVNEVLEIPNEHMEANFQYL